MSLSTGDRVWILGQIKSLIEDNRDEQDFKGETEFPAKHGDLWSRADDHLTEASFRRWVREEAARRERTENAVMCRLFDLNIIGPNHGRYHG